MGRNRKWVLENDLSEAVWRTISWGPRPPSVVWPRGSERPSSVSKGPGGLNQGRPPHHQSLKSRASKGLAKPCAPPSVRLSPHERCGRGSSPCCSFGSRSAGVGRDQSRGSANPGVAPQGPRTVPRPACWREVGFHPEVHPKIAGQDREDPSRPHPRTVSSAAVERLRDEAASSVPEPTPRPQEQMDVEDPAEGVRRLRAQIAELRHDRAAKQEAEENRAKKARILSTPPLAFVPDSFWSGRSAQWCLRCDVNSHRCRRFCIARSSKHVILPRCLSRYGLRATRVGEASNPGPPKFLRRLRRGASTISEVASTVPASSARRPSRQKPRSWWFINSRGHECG